MNAKTEKSTKLKSIYRISVSVTVSIIAAKIVFIIFWSFTFFPAISDSAFLGGLIFSIGAIAGLFAGGYSFIKLDKYLKEIMQNV